MSIERRITEKLVAAFRPLRLEVVNESHHHAGHAGSPGTGESHFRVMLVSPSFMGKSRIERHRMVNAALADELKGGVHALAIKAHAPEDAPACDA
jgi:BolA protein